MTPGLASATQHRPAHLLLGQCPLPVTFQMVDLILPCQRTVRATGSLLAVVGEAVILSVGTPRPNPPGGVRVGEAVFASVWTLQVIPPGGLMVPEAALPLYRLHIHTCDSSQATHTLSGRMSASVGCCGGSSVYGRSTDADLFKQAFGRLLTTKGCKSMIEYIKTTYIQPLTT